MTDAMMKPLGEANGVSWYWAEPGRFEKPGVYYWDGAQNVLCGPYPTALATKPEAPQAERVALKPVPDHELVTMYDEGPTSDAEMVSFARAAIAEFCRINGLPQQGEG